MPRASSPPTTRWGQHLEPQITPRAGTGRAARGACARVLGWRRGDGGASARVDGDARRPRRGSVPRGRTGGSGLGISPGCAQARRRARPQDCGRVGTAAGDLEAKCRSISRRRDKSSRLRTRGGRKGPSRMRSSPTSSSCTPPYESGRIPAARCNASNLASRATLTEGWDVPLCPGPHRCHRREGVGPGFLTRDAIRAAEVVLLGFFIFDRPGHRHG